MYAEFVKEEDVKVNILKFPEYFTDEMKNAVRDYLNSLIGKAKIIFVGIPSLDKKSERVKICGGFYCDNTLCVDVFREEIKTGGKTIEITVYNMISREEDAGYCYDTIKHFIFKEN